ncbi:MAG: hypothetical protein ACRC46_02610 [Thermoguttaceae bacterium]
MDIDSRLDKLIAAIEADRERIEADRERSEREMQELGEYMRTTFREMKESAAETERAMKESSAKTDRKIKAVSKQLGGMANSNGAAAENYFYNSLKKTKMFRNEKTERAVKNLWGRNRDLQDEYDLVLYNCNSIDIIEVKYNAQQKDVVQTLTKATTFRQIFPQYKDCAIYLGIASFVFDEAVEKFALDAGIAVIKQVGDAVVVNDSCLKKF